jgi:hypothetical protein
MILYFLPHTPQTINPWKKNQNSERPKSEKEEKAIPQFVLGYFVIRAYGQFIALRH